MAHAPASIPGVNSGVPAHWISTGNKINNILTRLVGIDPIVTARQAQLEKFSARCKQIEDELERRSAGLQSEGVRDAVLETKQTLEGILIGCEQWGKTTMFSRSVTDADIQYALTRWDRELSDSMSAFARGLMFEILESTSVPDHDTVTRYMAMLEQGETLAALLKSVEQRVDMTEGQIKLLLDKGQQFYLQETNSPDLTPGERTILFDGLKSVLTSSDAVPASVELKGEVKIEPMLVKSNHASDIYRGIWNETVVAVKLLRDPEPQPDRVAKFKYEGYIWRMLRHRNVLPFYGIHTDIHQRIALVTPWMEERDVMTHMPRHLDTHKNDICNRRAIVKGIADGITFLHRRGMVHGDIRGSNILIDHMHEPRITDFGLAACSSTNQGLLFDGMSSSQMTTTIRWLAPERCRSGPESYPVQASDVFSFARTVLEVITGEKPFPLEKNAWHISFLLQSGQLVPPRPSDEGSVRRGLTDEVWALLVRMWAQNPSSRPKMIEVQEVLEDCM